VDDPKLSRLTGRRNAMGKGGVELDGRDGSRCFLELFHEADGVDNGYGLNGREQLSKSLGGAGIEVVQLGGQLVATRGLQVPHSPMDLKAIGEHLHQPMAEHASCPEDENAI